MSSIQLFRTTFVIAYLFTFFSCNQEYKPTEEKIISYEQPLIEANKRLNIKDEERIIAYWKRRNWNMTKTNTGLWYEIYNETQKPKIMPDDFVTLEYTLELLDGTEIYSSQKNGHKKFRVGKSGSESGLEEAILQLHEGESAKIIIPPYLAFGLIGDENRIPARATLVYDLTVIDVSKY